MKNFFKLICILFVLLVSGCATNKPPETAAPVVISKTSYVFVPIPDNLTSYCKVELPPSIKDYLAADWPNKEAILTVYIKSLITNMNTCNIKFFNLRKWNQSQKDIYDSKSKE